MNHIDIYCGGTVTVEKDLVPPKAVHRSFKPTTQEALQEFAELQVKAGAAEFWNIEDDNVTAHIGSGIYYASLGTAMVGTLRMIADLTETGEISFHSATGYRSIDSSFQYLQLGLRVV